MTPRDGDEPFWAVATPVDFDGHTMRVGAVPALGHYIGEVLDEPRCELSGSLRPGDSS